MSSAPLAAEAYADETLWPATAESIVDIRVFHDARRAKLVGEIAAGEVLELEVIGRRVFGAVRQCRDALLRLPDSRSADVAAALAIDAIPVHETLREALECELHAISTLFSQKADE